MQLLVEERLRRNVQCAISGASEGPLCRPLLGRRHLPGRSLLGRSLPSWSLARWRLLGRCPLRRCPLRRSLLGRRSTISSVCHAHPLNRSTYVLTSAPLSPGLADTGRTSSVPRRRVRCASCPSRPAAQSLDVHRLEPLTSPYNDCPQPDRAMTVPSRDLLVPAVGRRTRAPRGTPSTGKARPNASADPVGRALVRRRLGRDRSHPRPAQRTGDGRLGPPRVHRAPHGHRCRRRWPGQLGPARAGGRRRRSPASVPRAAPTRLRAIDQRAPRVRTRRRHPNDLRPT